MRRFKSIYFFLVVVVFFLACSQKKNTPQPVAAVQKVDKKISIHEIGRLEFIKSYSFVQSTTLNKKEIEKMWEETENSNPKDRNPADSALLRRFQKLGFVKDDGLLLDKFKYSNNLDTWLISPGGEKIRTWVEQDSTSGSNDKLIVSSGTDTAEIKIASFMQLEYALLDVKPGGNKEVVILNEHYLSNTYLYNLFVYEIKTVR
ncbi:MAG TPA: hypothetical protein VFI06_01305 [Chitinophagaceae bacterium]|nr:hypothetical protein [Chitinophagaceae bacterium]